jgi:hypothetical protein
VTSPHLMAGIPAAAITAAGRQGQGESDDKYADRCRRVAQRLEDEKWENAVRMTVITMNRWRAPRPAVLVVCLRGDVFKTRAMRLAEACKGRWVHARGGYILSLKQARLFETLYRLGLDHVPK